MAVRSFQAKLLILILAVMLLLQAATLISVHVAGRRATSHAVATELRVGTRVLDRILETRARQLSDSLRVLALDFAFREAIASSDVPTISSVLANHGSRISADAVFLIDLDGTVVADTIGGRLAGHPFPFTTLVGSAETAGEGSATVSFMRRPFQFVIVPVLAPRAIAWVCAGFAVDEKVIEDVRRLTSLDVSLWSSAADEEPQLISTHSGAARSAVTEQMEVLSRRSEAVETTVQLGDEEYATLLHPLPTGDGSRVNALFQRSLVEARKPFTTLELQIFGFSSIGLLAAVLAAVIFARTVSQPLQALGDAAERVAGGDYQTPIEVTQSDEIGQLGNAFNEMRRAIAERERRIVYQATHDELTALPNRTLFLERLRDAIEKSKRSGEAVGMLMMDVDRFKEINDTLGHGVGDELLMEIGRRLSRILPSSETVARLGGDEFAVRFSAASRSGAYDVSRRVTSAFNAPFELGEMSINLNASVGVALYPDHAEDAETLMKRADVAMYDAKKNQSGVAIYEAGRDEHSLRRLALMMELRQAVDRDELELYYQPKVDMLSERPLHAEALVRWNHATHGVMRPDEFIPLAEQSGNIGIVTKCVLRKAIRQAAEWQRDGLDLSVAVNLSAHDLRDVELPTFISGLLADAGLPATRLVLEITESAVMKDATHAQKVLADLKTRGLTLAIDDFGTGYSSLAHLKRLPVDELKIDKSFVLNLTGAATNDLVIVRSTIELGHNMGLVVIAEGVESAESWQILKDMGCDMAQGYLMSRPLPAGEFAAWMAKGAAGFQTLGSGSLANPRDLPS